MNTLPIHDSDRKAAEEASKCDEIRSIITDQINRHVGMKSSSRAWLADDITNRVLAVIAPLFIARHHAEERAETEKVIGSLQSRISELNEIRVRVVDERDSLKMALETIYRHAQRFSGWWSHNQARTALRTAGQNPPT